ncbi:MAG: hypothetical protein WCT31_05330, partial [Candidatus Micrarchaeia archaeon]
MANVTNEQKPADKLIIGKNEVYMVAAGVLLILLIASVFTGGFGILGNKTATVTNQTATFVPDMAKINEIKTLLEDNYFVSTGQTATITYVNATHESGFITITYSAEGQEVPITISDDYKYIFGSSPMDLELIKQQMAAAKTQAGSQTTTTTPAEKVDKPTAQGFIMAYCPYGLQFLKAYVPVMELLGDKADISVNFVQYAMHGKKELDGNNYIYCVQKNNKPLLTNYLRCAVENGDYSGCVASTIGLNSSTIDACVVSLDAQYNITGLYNNQSTWLSGQYPMYPVEQELASLYGVQGSPTFVLNGKSVSVSRTSEAI